VVGRLDADNGGAEGRYPTRLSPADVEALCAAGYDERALDFFVFVTAVCTRSNRMMQGCGRTTPRPAGRREALERLYRQG
jgi:hypothetical protein